MEGIPSAETTETENTQEAVQPEVSTETAEETENASVENLALDNGETTQAAESDSTVATTEKSYFTSADGLLKINTDGHVGYYLFNEKGYLMTGRVTREPGVDGYTGTKKVEWYLLEKDKATLYTGCEGQEITPWTSNLGQ